LAEILTLLEGSALGQAMRGMGVWSYGVYSLGHILGISLLFGSIVALDLRLLGLWRGVRLSVIATPLIPLAALGFSVAAISGICMISTNATDYLGNPFLYIKFPAIALGLVNILVLQLMPAWRHRQAHEPSRGEQIQLAVAGGTSLLCWLTAITAGRMIGYW
jgi:hypothetical protein